MAETRDQAISQRRNLAQGWDRQKPSKQRQVSAGGNQRTGYGQMSTRASSLINPPYGTREVIVAKAEATPLGGIKL